MSPRGDGHAVLMVNPRGSQGYGRSFVLDSLWLLVLGAFTANVEGAAQAAPLLAGHEGGAAGGDRRVAGADDQRPVNANAPPVLDEQYPAAQEPGQAKQDDGKKQHPDQQEAGKG